MQFSQCDEIYNRVLGVDGLSCLLPSELHPGMVKMSVFSYGSDTDTTIRATTVPVALHIRSSGFDGESCKKTAKGLERDSIKTSRGKTKWYDSGVRLILENEKYMVDALLQKTYTVDYLKKKRVRNTCIVP